MSEVPKAVVFEHARNQWEYVIDKLSGPNGFDPLSIDVGEVAVSSAKNHGLNPLELGLAEAVALIDSKVNMDARALLEATPWPGGDFRTDD